MLKKDPVIWLAYVSYPVTTAVYIQRALRKNNKVITCGPQFPQEMIKTWQLENMKLPIQKLDISTGFQLDLKEALSAVHKDHHPDLFLWVESVHGYYPENIKGNGFPTACYLIDSHVNLSMHLDWAKRFDYVFIAQKEYIPDFYNAGVKNVFWLPLACDPEIHSKRTEIKKYDIGFVGSTNGDSQVRRRSLLEKLKSNFNFGYKRCFWEEMAEFFSSSRIVFNNALKNDLNMRLFEVMSTGSFLLTDIAKNSGQEEMFKDGECLGIYKDDNIVEVAGYYLKHENEREKIAAIGQQIMHNAHTYSHRCEELIKVCFGEKSNTPSPEEWRDRSIAPLKSSVSFNSQKEIQTGKKNKIVKRSFVIPVLDMSPASPYNIAKLLDDLTKIEGDVIVIFNSIEMAEQLKDHPRIDYFATMKENVGVSRAWNIGLNISQSPITFILNSDLQLTGETVERMEQYLLELPDAAIVGPQGSFFDFHKCADIYHFDKGSFENPVEVDAVSGFLFAVKTELFNSGILKFDNQYTPCYYEEWDIGLQCKMAGLKSYVIPAAGYNHEWSGSIRALRTIKYLDKEETAGEIHQRNTKLFKNKWNGIAQLHEDNSLLISKWVDLMLSLADSFIKKNDNFKAAEIYEQILILYPKDKRALLNLALNFYKNNRLEDALNYFGKISEIEPEFKIPADLLSGMDFNNLQNTISFSEPADEGSSSDPDEITEDKVEGYYENPRLDIQQIVNPASKKILDVGCGSGTLAFELKKKLNAEVWGIEYFAKAASDAAEKLDRVFSGKIESSINKLPDNYFDTIIFADVLEHLVDPYKVLSKIKKKLSKDGQIIASIPNIRFWPIVKELIEGRWTYTNFGILDNTHLRFFTYESMKAMFENAGYEIISQYGKVIQDAEIPFNLVQSYASAGLDVKTLSNESKVFQYVLILKSR